MPNEELLKLVREEIQNSLRETTVSIPGGGAGGGDTESVVQTAIAPHVQEINGIVNNVMEIARKRLVSILSMAPDILKDPVKVRRELLNELIEALQKV